MDLCINNGPVTISSSALFQRDIANVSSTVTLPRALELRQLPFRTEAPIDISPSTSSQVLGNAAYLLRALDMGFDPKLNYTLREAFVPFERKLVNFSSEQLNPIFNAPGNAYITDPAVWIYSALNRIINNGSVPSWSQEGWSFVPISLEDATISKVQAISPVIPSTV